MIPTGLAIPALAALAAGAFWLFLDGAHWPFVAGMAIAAGAPLAFVLRHRLSRTRLTEHPLLVSILSGLGCVTVMIGIQRFGSERDWVLLSAVAALIVWVLWQRGQRRMQLPPRS